MTDEGSIGPVSDVFVSSAKTYDPYELVLYHSESPPQGQDSPFKSGVYFDLRL